MRKQSLALAGLVALLALLIAPLLFQSGAESPARAAQNGAGAPGIALQMPPFFSTARGANLYQSTIADYFAGGVAGIAAYTNVGKDIDVDKLAKSSVFQTVEDAAPGEYVIGSVVVSGFKDSMIVAEFMQVHVFAQREGWIVAYLTPEQPTAQIVDWSAFRDSKFSNTTLEDAMQQVAKTAAVTTGDVGYYHFSFPDATNLMFVGDTIVEGNPRGDNFTIEIPTALALYETSLSHSTFGDLGITYCSLNGDELSRLDVYGNDWFVNVKQIAISDWQDGKSNEVGLWSEWDPNDDKVVNCGIAFVYGVAE